MKNIRLLIIFFTVLILAGELGAQTPKLTASAPQTVGTGQQFRVNYSFNQQGSNFKGPTFKDFNFITGPNQSSSSSVQIINGAMTQNVAFTYSYVLQAVKEGSFEIPSASIEYNGTLYKSAPITINVVKGSTPVNPSYGNQSPNTNRNTPTPTEEVGSKEIFIRGIPDKSNPYQGEQIIITYKLYTSVGVAQYGINKLPSYSGFWNVDLLKDQGNKAKQYRETIDGKQYMVAEIRKVALFPQKSGTLTIDPLEVDALVQVQARRKNSGNFFDDFFNDSFFNPVQNVKKTLKSNMISISVKPFPGNKPADFNGFSGNLNLKASIDKTEIKANEAINLKLTVSGNGNLKLIDKVNPEFPPDFETYDPKVVDNITSSTAGVSGSRTFEYLIIPRKEGVFKIKSIHFSYFNLAQKAFVELNTPEFTIKVAKGVGGQSAATTLTTSKEDIKYIGSDIRFIKTNPGEIREKGSLFFGSMMFWGLMLMPILLFTVFIIAYRKRIKQGQNTALLKNKKANRVALKRLAQAEKHLKAQQKDLFFEELSKAIWGYVSDKYNISLAQLSMDNVYEVLLAKQVDTQLIDRLTEVLNHCEYSRFAPGSESQTLDSHYQEALSLIRKLESKVS